MPTRTLAPSLALMSGAAATAGALAALLSVLPLYTTQSLGFSNAQYARLLTLRMSGIVAGVIVLGALGDRFGVRRVTAACMAVCGLCFAVLGFVPGVLFIVLIPIVSGLLSTAFVNLNQLAQTLAPQRQGRTNTIYRAAAMTGAIVAPPVMVRLLAHMPWAMTGVGAALLLAAACLRRAAPVEPLRAMVHWREECAGLARTYHSALRQRRLMLFIVVILAWLSLGCCVDAFFAIRLTQQLAASTQFYGNTVALGSGAALATVLLLGLLLDRPALRPILLLIGLIGSISIVVMGLVQSPWLLAASYIAYTSAVVGIMAPMSIWIGRQSDAGTLGAALAVHKVLTAVFNGSVALALGWIEPWLQIPRLTLICGLAGLPLLLLLATLREPARPAPHPA